MIMNLCQKRLHGKMTANFHPQMYASNLNAENDVYFFLDNPDTFVRFFEKYPSKANIKSSNTNRDLTP